MNKKNVLIFALVMVVIVAAATTVHFLNRVTLYDDETITGNTSGNLLNGGLFCESDGTIFFSNIYDEGMLYSMDSNLENVKQLSDDNVSYINAAGKYVFYTKRNDKKGVDTGDFFMTLSTTGLFRVNRKGQHIGKLYDDPTQVACLYGNNVYYQHYDETKGLLLYAAKIDGSEDTPLLESPCAPYAISDNLIYYSGMDKDHSIHTVNLDGRGDQVLYEGNCTAVTIQNEYLYFLDMNEDYSLKRIPASGGTPETLVSTRLATYNVSEDGSTIYYQVDNGTDDNGLYELDIYSMSQNLIASGNYNYLNLTTNYLFYQTYDQSKQYILNLATGATQEWDWKKK